MINLDKSKVMVFRKGGWLAAHGKWFFGSEEIEVVSRYKYLGVIFTLGLSFVEYVEGRSEMAKSSLNAIWFRFIVKNYTRMEAKWNEFHAVKRAVTKYGAQVWDFRFYDSLELVQRLFVKNFYRFLDLPKIIWYISN